MGLLDKIFGSNRASDNTAMQQVWPSFKTFTDYCPVFTSFRGGIYEQELTRAAIERFSSACSKLKPELVGKPSPAISKMVETAPNRFMTWPSMLARAAAIYECDTTLFIVPVFKPGTDEKVGIMPLKCEYAEVLEYCGEPWFRFHFASGDTAVMEMRNTAVVTKFQYTSDFFGEPNCIDKTMQLIHAQAEAQENAIKSGAKIRFIAGVGGQMREEDMRKKRDRFAEDNFGAGNTSGLMIYDTTFRDVKQVEPQSWVISAEEMDRIHHNVYTYFGINQDILQNHYTEDVWGAWYEGKIEPFAVKMGEALTAMLFSDRARVQSDTKLTFSSNRLEYSSNASKRNMVRDMVDRGIMSINEGREVLQMPRFEGGDVRVIRGEYINASALDSNTANRVGSKSPMGSDDEDRDLGGKETFYSESDAHEQGDE